MRPWVSKMPRWNALFLLPPSKTFESVRLMLAAPEGAYIARLIWGFRDPLQAPYLKRRHEGVVLGTYASFADVVAVSHSPRGSPEADNYVTDENGKYHLETIFKEPKEAWGAPTCDLLARTPDTVEELLEPYVPSGWIVILQGLTSLIPKLGTNPVFD